MKLYIARHGRTNYNDLGLCNADPRVDAHLTPQGIEQANALADKLKQAPIDHIFISELRRTRQTADIVNAFHHVPVEVDPLLNDHRSGYEGKPFKLLMDALDASDDRWTARFHDGESIEDLKKRVATFLDNLKTKQHDSVLIVTSQWIIYSILIAMQHITNEEAWALEVSQGSCRELDLR